VVHKARLYFEQMRHLNAVISMYEIRRKTGAGMRDDDLLREAAEAEGYTPRRIYRTHGRRHGYEAVIFMPSD